MKCPPCGGVLEAWAWQDGDGYKGVKCSACGAAWWSESFVRKLHKAINSVVRATESKVINESDFPEDAESAEDRRTRFQGLPRIRKG